MRPVTFRTKFNAQQLLLEEFFDIMCIFSKVEPQTGSTFSFQYTAIFETYQFLEPPSSTPGGIDMCAHGIFCTEFNAQLPLYGEAFSRTVHIFGSVEPQTESTFPFEYNVIY